jgi:pimeloyl-ACP methyl ester carboxylesterase
MMSIGGLSPRRRALVVVIFAILLAAAVAIAITTLPKDGDRLAATRPLVAQDRPGAVLLVPGYGGGTGSLSVLATRLKAAGRDVTIVKLPGDATGDLNQQADALEASVESALDKGFPSVDIVGFSAGGVVARVWVQRHDGARKARRIVTLGSPHHGAQLAAAGTAAVPGACPDACQQLAPGSRFLAELASPVPRPPQWLSLWTANDQVVVPPDSARLDGAVNVELQALCPSLRLGHAGLPTDPLPQKLVLDAIGAASIAVPAYGCVNS